MVNVRLPDGSPGGACALWVRVIDKSAQHTNKPARLGSHRRDARVTGIIPTSDLGNTTQGTCCAVEALTSRTLRLLADDHGLAGSLLRYGDDSASYPFRGGSGTFLPVKISSSLEIPTE